MAGVFLERQQGFRWKTYEHPDLAQEVEQNERSLVRDVYETDGHAVEVRGMILSRTNVEAHNVGGQDQWGPIREVDNQPERPGGVRQVGKEDERATYAEVEDFPMNLV